MEKYVLEHVKICSMTIPMNLTKNTFKKPNKGSEFSDIK